jgi:hypothetical protein
MRQSARALARQLLGGKRIGGWSTTDARYSADEDHVDAGRGRTLPRVLEDLLAHAIVQRGSDQAPRLRGMRAWAEVLGDLAAVRRRARRRRVRPDSQ